METKDNIIASEALFGFAAWLTTRETTVIASRVHDASVWAGLVDEFMKANNLQDPREDYHKRFVMPKEKT